MTIMNFSISLENLTNFRAGAAALAAALFLSSCGESEKQETATLSDLGYEANSPEEFHRAAENGAAEAVDLFVDYGMDVDSLSMTGLTPLMTAAKSGQLSTVKQLIDFGSAIESEDPEGRTPLIIAAGEGHTDVARLLLGRGAKHDARDSEGWNALTLSAFNGHAETVELLASQPGKDGLDEALLVACFRGEADTITTLLTNGAYVNSRSPANQTPLMIAAQNGHLSAVRALIKGGANPFSLDNSGKTSADLAEASGYTDVTDFLLDPDGLMVVEGNPEEDATFPSGKVLDSTLAGAQSMDGAVIETKSTTGESSSGKKTTAFEELALESFREESLPIMFKGIENGEAKVRVLSQPGSDPVVVDRGAQIEGTNYRVVDYREKFISGKEGGGNTGNTVAESTDPLALNEDADESIDVSEVVVQNVETGEEHELVKDIAGRSNISYAVLTTPDSSARYIVHPNDKFTTKDDLNGEVEYEVLDIRPTQVVVQDLATLDVFTIARDGLVVMNTDEEEIDGE